MGKGHIFCIIGKSASGKDSLFRAVLEKCPVPLRTVIPYTTRPIRSHEVEGVEYFFKSIPEFEQMRTEGRIIEYRCYHTVHGDWYYFTADDGQIDEEHDYLVSTVLGGYENLLRYFGSERVIPIYIEVEDGLRLSRALERERSQEHPKFAEMCRRFLADSEDFCEENIQRLGIEKRFENNDFDTCLKAICREIASYASTKS